MTGDMRALKTQSQTADSFIWGEREENHWPCQVPHSLFTFMGPAETLLLAVLSSAFQLTRSFNCTDWKNSTYVVCIVPFQYKFIYEDFKEGGGREIETDRKIFFKCQLMQRKIIFGSTEWREEGFIFDLGWPVRSALSLWASAGGFHQIKNYLSQETTADFLSREQSLGTLAMLDCRLFASNSLSLLCLPTFSSFKG